MKTITLKADDRFDALLSRLAKRLNTSRSAVIRDAVQRYEQQLEKDALRRQLGAASRKTRAQAEGTAKELDAAVGDGL
jgi:predicted transcriptional regulator